jgi:hypothetical protein
MSKTLETLSSLEMLALSKAISFASVNDEAVLPEGTSAPVSFTVEIDGTVVRGQGSNRLGTNHARSVPVICLLLAEMGVTRNFAPAHIIQLWSTLGGLDKATLATRRASLDADKSAALEAMEDLFESQIVANLPRIPSKGGVKFKAS